MGDTTIALALTSPENDYLAVEVHRPGIGSLLRQTEENKLSNIRVINHDVIEVLEFQLPDNSFDCVYVYFPDPWPKKKHHKRRLINRHFLYLLKDKLKPNARIFLSTDWEDYAARIMEVFETTTGFINLAGKYQYAPRPRWRPMTKFEQRSEKLNHRVLDLVFSFKQID
jgi:tRNA (guanine-N7-)-methyltransferase